MNISDLDENQKAALKVIKKARKKKFFKSKAFLIGVAINLVTWYLFFFRSDSDKEKYFPYVVFTLFLFLVYQMRKHRSDNDIITLQKEEIAEQRDQIEKQKVLVEEHQKEIVDSINYAKRIQDAILPQTDLIKARLNNAFVLFKPKDIVAGDFYWMEQINDTVLIAVADCTGHGVPGAMVSVVCNNALNRAVKEFHLSNTGAILDKTRSLVLETFEKSIAEVNDGMDISLLSINEKTKQIHWSGANNSLLYFEGNELKEIAPDKQPIGKSSHSKPFTTHVIDYKPNTTFYLFTDGYADQFGGPKAHSSEGKFGQGKKFKFKQFKEVLSANVDKTLNEQQTVLFTAFESWKGQLEQVDDVCIIGIKI